MHKRNRVLIELALTIVISWPQISIVWMLSNSEGFGTIATLSLFFCVVLVFWRWGRVGYVFWEGRSLSDNSYSTPPSFYDEGGDRLSIVPAEVELEGDTIKTVALDDGGLPPPHPPPIPTHVWSPPTTSPPMPPPPKPARVWPPPRTAPPRSHRPPPPRPHSSQRSSVAQRVSKYENTSLLIPDLHQRTLSGSSNISEGRETEL